MNRFERSAAAHLVTLTAVLLGCSSRWAPPQAPAARPLGAGSEGKRQGSDRSEPAVTSGVAGHPRCDPGSPRGRQGPNQTLALGVGLGCAVMDVPGGKGSVLCWGAIGPWLSPPLPNDHPVRPTVIPGLTDVVDLAAAISTCARTRSGAVWCWGREPGTFGGDYEIVAAHAVAGIEDARCLSVHDSNACVAESSGKVLCWGDNFQGQVGDGTRTARRQPVPVDLPFAALGVSPVGRKTRVATARTCSRSAPPAPAGKTPATGIG